jgi:putative ABC transport system permease protein
VAIASEGFARRFFDGRNPTGKSVEVYVGKEAVARLDIVGYVRDARYRNLRDPILPALYLPLDERRSGTLLVRTSANAPPMAARLRTEVSRAHPGFRARNVATQTALVQRHSIRERLLAALSVFFAATALVLAGMGLYSVLSYSVLQRKREIGIRMALGARMPEVVRSVTLEATLPIFTGSVIGAGCGILCERYARSLLFEVKATDVRTLALPAITLLTIAVIAAAKPVLRAIRIDPAQTLRGE